MSKIFRIKKGLDIPILGDAEKTVIKSKLSKKYALKPTDFQNLTPKLKVKVGHKVKVGSPLFFDKYNPEILFTSTVSGEVIEINRGERRRILEVVVKVDENMDYENFLKGDPDKLSKEEIIKNLLDSGLWASIRQRPYEIIANPKDTPKAIFISTFDTSPLAVDYDFILENEMNNFQNGVEALRKLSDKIYLNTHKNSTLFDKIKDVEINKFDGKHPAGNIGTQINKISPINKGEIVWHINPQDIIFIGRLFSKGIYDAKKIIALTGPQIENPKYYEIISGANIENIINNNIKEGNSRYISGNVLTGTDISRDKYLSFYHSQITVILEGNYHAFLGWALPNFNKFSVSRSFFSWLTPKKKYSLDSNFNGGKRAFVMTNQYEKVFPFDIIPVHLLKSIIINDIDAMEQLGIYEVAEEDFALCEFVCSSKIEVQKIIREGLNVMIKEMN